MTVARPWLKTPASAGVFACALLFCGLLLAGCATPQTDILRQAWPVSLPVQARLELPFVAQADQQCGPAALAMVLAHAGRPVALATLSAQVFVPARGGSLQAEMLAAARRHERLSVVLPPRLDAVLAEVAAGRPVIVLQNLALPIAPRWHYAVVVGYDQARGEIVLHSGTHASLALPLAVFERTWARSERWAMVVTPADRLPLTPSPDALLAATAALERTQPAVARATYQALVARAPDLGMAWFGLGNSAAAGSDLAVAEHAFAQAVRLEPERADAWHNLAVVRLARGEVRDAHAAAARAVALGGVRLAQYRETLESVERATAGSIPLK